MGDGWTPEDARAALVKWGEIYGIPHADRLHVRRDTGRGRTWAVVVLGDAGGHFPIGPEFATWPSCESFVHGLIDGWRTTATIRRVVEAGHITSHAPHPYAVS